MPSMPTGDAERFRERYRVAGARALVEAELEALGSDYQGSGYTTVPQAEELGRLVQLGAGDRLLDVGSGCGWPGLYLATLHGSSVVGTDPVVEGLRAAVDRAARDGMTGRHRVVCGNGDALPFRTATFDAVVHTDVVC